MFFWLGIVLPCAAGAASMVVEDGKMTAKLSATPFTEVIPLLRDQAGIEVRLRKVSVAGRKVSLDLDRVPIDRALKQILKNAGLVSQAILYDAKSGKPTTVIAVEQGGGSSAPQIAEAMDPDEEEESEEDVDALNVIETVPYVAPDSPPAEVPALDEPEEIPAGRAPAYVAPAEPPRYVEDPNDPEDEEEDSDADS